MFKMNQAAALIAMQQAARTALDEAASAQAEIQKSTTF